MRRQKIFRPVKKLIKNEKGSVVVLFAFALAVMIGFLGLTIDVGYGYLQKTKLQNALDAAVLAGVQSLPDNTAQARNDAIAFAGNNGITLATSDVTVSSDNMTITCSKTVSVSPIFGSVLGLSSWNISGNATAAVTSTADPSFDYVIFSAGESQSFTDTGGNWTVNGKVHINGYTTFTGGNRDFNDDYECVGDITVTGGNNTWGDLITNGSFHKTGGHHSYNLVSPTSVMPIPEYDLQDFRDRAAVYYSTSQSFTGDKLTLNGIMYVNGDISFTGSKVEGRGSIVATGNINLTGGGFKYQTPTSDLVALYAGGNINITGGSSKEFDGVLYAPNGSINMTGGNCDFYGSLVTQRFTITGGNHTFTHDSRSGEAFGTRRVKLTG
ncbi:MAG: TadE/TadG family type IV pilus assembly protein [Bacillota bacterium]